MNSKKSKIIGFRPTPRQAFELDNICKELDICAELNIKKSALIRFIQEDFINKYEKAKGYE